MKTPRLFLLLCLAAPFGCGALDVPAPEGEESGEVAAAAQGLVARDTAIAWLDAKGRVTGINTAVLRKQFIDGGPILEFKVISISNGFNLLRRGRTMAGANHTDTVPLLIAIKKLVIGDLKWIVTCDSAACSFCAPNFNRTACECGSGGGCNFGITPDLGFETIVL